MKISDAIKTLQAIQAEFGDIAITGGTLTDDAPLTRITVTNTKGQQIWPRAPHWVAGTHPVDGVFLN